MNDFDLDDDFDYFDDPDPGSVVCLLCDADGVVVTCVDDICRAQGDCIHGDGMALCRCQVSAT